METQNNRIPTNTNEALVLFYNKILATDGQRFTVNDAANFVAQYNFGTAKSTIDRALRYLRSKKKINYFLANRLQSIFQAIVVDTAAPVESASKDGIGEY